MRERVGVKIPGKSSEHLFIFLVGKVRGVLAMHSTYAMLWKIGSENRNCTVQRSLSRACSMVYVCECTGGPLGPAA